MGTGAPIYDHHHAVQFYSDDEGLCSTVAGFLSQGFVDGHPAIVIATRAHTEGILAHLRGRFIDVEKAQQTGSLVVLDAQQTLDLFMDGDEPNEQRFESSIGRLVSNMVSGGKDRILIRAFGEMVDVLWKQRRMEAALRLETLWNRLAQQYGFALLCGYAMGNFTRQTRGFEQICREHTHVIAPLAKPAAGRRRVS
jgi:hypothetical protein